MHFTSDFHENIKYTVNTEKYAKFPSSNIFYAVDTCHLSSNIEETLPPTICLHTHYKRLAGEKNNEKYLPLLSVSLFPCVSWKL